MAPGSLNVAEQRGGDQANSEKVAENILTANPDVKVWAGVADSYMLGVIAAIKNRGLDPKDFIITGIDAIPEFLEADEGWRRLGYGQQPG